MTFFNRKEEVLDFRLTRVGREKLASGSFQPTFYEFFDDGVIYDIEWATRGTSEEQNEIAGRIKRGPFTKPQSGFQQAIDFDDKRKPLLSPYPSMGTFDIFNSYKPAWSINMLKGQLVTSSAQISYDIPESAAAAGGTREKVPQLDLRCDYNLRTYTDIDKTSIDPTKGGSFNLALKVNDYLTPKDVFPNGNENSVMFLKKSFDDFTILFQEENVLSSSHGFTIEVFKYEYDTNDTVKSLKPLYFNDAVAKEDSVEWYFDITFDDAETKVSFVDEKISIKATEDECVVPEGGG